MADPIDRIINIIFRAQGEMTMDSLCLPGAEQRVREHCGEQLNMEIEQWFRSKWELCKFEER